MALRRLLLAVVVCAAVGGALSGRALAIAPPPCPPAEPALLRTPHFNIYYSGDPTATNYITETQAGDLGAMAEHAYGIYTAMGYPAPLDDGTGRSDFYVFDLSTWKYSSYDCGGGVFLYDSGTLANADQAPLAMEWDVFALVEERTYSPGINDGWLEEASAEWAAATVLGYPAATITDLGPPGTTLDCWDANQQSKCSKVGYENLALSRWTFFEYLSERFGKTFLQEVLVDAQAAGSAYTGLSNALIAHGTTFADVFNAWANTDLTSGYTIPALQTLKPIAYVKIPTGTVAGALAPVTVPVDHLATRYVEFDRGNGSTTGACYAATLTISVTIPAGTLSKPAFYWTGAGSSPVPLAISGSTATATVPWDTCTWSGSMGLLSLPNASTTINSANFVVSGSLTVDTTQPVTSTPPPAPISVNTPVVPVSSADVAPAISVFGPELIALSPADRQLRLIVESSGEGLLQAALGSVALGNATLRPGNNDVRFTVPQSLLSSLRRSATAANILTLTPVSTSGAATGQPVTRTVSLAPATTPKPAVKAKPKLLKKKKH
jgi:hypothetical protein